MIYNLQSRNLLKSIKKFKQFLYLFSLFLGHGDGLQNGPITWLDKTNQARRGESLFKPALRACGLRHKSPMTKSRLTDGWGIIQNRWWMVIVSAVKGFRWGRSELSDIVYCKGGIKMEFCRPTSYRNGDILSAQAENFYDISQKLVLGRKTSRLFCSGYWFLELIIKRVMIHLICR